MKAKTYTDYYNILLEGCKEAFKSIELKEYLYTNEAMEDNKEYFISKDCIKQIGTNISNNLIVNYQIERDMKTDFLRFLERQQQVFEKKYLIPRNEFYEKCLKSLNIKLTELNRQEYRVLKNISDMGTPPDPLLFLEYMKWDIKSKSLQTNKTPEPQQAKNIKTDEVIKEFKDFFIPDVKIETINNIQTNYKDLIGKKMAFLIYLLETEFKIINYSLNGKNDSRKHFVKSLKSIDTKMQGINKHFEANSTNLSIHKFENDNDYKKIKDFLTKTI